MIELRSLRVCFSDIEILNLEHLNINAQERLGVLGINGSGKSTLLRVLAGLLEPSSGSLKGIAPPGKTVLVHQRPHLYRGSVLLNIERALSIAGRPLHEAMPWLEKLGAASLAKKPASTLSGGERRRVAIARALCIGPELLLLDEPLAALDHAGHQTVLQVIADYQGTLVIAGPTLDERFKLDRVIEL